VTGAMAAAGRCPSELDILRHLHAPQPELERHAEACPGCAARISEALRSAETFRRQVFPATLDSVVERSRPWRPRAWMLAPIPALAAAAVLVLLVRPTMPPPDYVGVKGGLALSVYVRDAGGEGARAASDGQVVPPDAAIRFEVRAARACHLWLVSVDASGQVSRLHPATGDPPRVKGDTVLPGGAMLDGTPGPERLFAVCTPSPLPFAEVERIARAAAPGGETSVRSLRTLPDLPNGALQATVLLEKRR